MTSTVRRHRDFRAIARMLGTEGVTVSTVAKRFGLSEGALFYFRKQQVAKQEKKEKAARPASVRLRSEALHYYLQAQSNEDNALGRRAAKREKEANDQEDAEDYVRCLNTPIGWADSDSEEEPTIIEELTRLDRTIGNRFQRLTNGARKPPAIIRFLEERTGIVERFREILKERQEWRQQQREAWRSKLRERLASPARRGR